MLVLSTTREPVAWVMGGVWSVTTISFAKILSTLLGGPALESLSRVSTRRRTEGIPAEADCEYWGRDRDRRFAHLRSRLPAALGRADRTLRSPRNHPPWRARDADTSEQKRCRQPQWSRAARSSPASWLLASSCYILSIDG